MMNIWKRPNLTLSLSRQICGERDSEADVGEVYGLFIDPRFEPMTMETGPHFSPVFFGLELAPPLGKVGSKELRPTSPRLYPD